MLLNILLKNNFIYIFLTEVNSLKTGNDCQRIVVTPNYRSLPFLRILRIKYNSEKKKKSDICILFLLYGTPDI